MLLVVGTRSAFLALLFIYLVIRVCILPCDAAPTVVPCSLAVRACLPRLALPAPSLAPPVSL